MFPPDLLHRKLQFLMMQVFLINANFSRLFLSAILYYLSAILQAERSGFRLYDALKNRSTGSFSFLQFYSIQNAADLRLYTKYELWSIESFDYTNLMCLLSRENLNSTFSSSYI